MRLLIAEDEMDLAEALTAFFEKNHFSVDAVHNGADAYEYAVSGGYDAVILDVMMPRMNGIQVLERLRAEGVKTPIMMLTAKGETTDKVSGLKQGADDYITKPFNILELKARVRALLRRAGVSKSEKSTPFPSSRATSSYFARRAAFAPTFPFPRVKRRD